jgi:hypothetical protein
MKPEPRFVAPGERHTKQPAVSREAEARPHVTPTASTATVPSHRHRAASGGLPGLPRAGLATAILMFREGSYAAIEASNAAFAADQQRLGLSNCGG